MHTYLQIGFASAQGEQETEGGGAGGQWIDHGSLVYKTLENVNKGRDFLKADLLIEALTECQLWLCCLLWEKNELGTDRRDKSRAADRRLCLHCIWARLSVGISSPPAGL